VRGALNGDVSRVARIAWNEGRIAAADSGKAWCGGDVDGLNSLGTLESCCVAL
jgi:hypothetical protein